MSRKFFPSEIIYTPEGNIYNVLAGICFILVILFAISMVVSDILNKAFIFDICFIFVMLLGLLFFIFDNKSMKNSTIKFL